MGRLAIGESNLSGDDALPGSGRSQSRGFRVAMYELAPSRTSKCR